MIGSKAIVVSTVDADGGQVKIGGEVWSARGVGGHRPLPPGTPVTVVEVRGATAVVIWGLNRHSGAIDGECRRPH